MRGIEYVELYVGNALQAAHYYRTALGFRPTAYAGPETGTRDRASIALEQGEIRFVVTSPLDGDGAIAEHVRRHGDGVRDIAFGVEDAVEAFEMAVARGAVPILEPHRVEDERGARVKATVGSCGATVHSLVQWERGDRSAPPGWRPVAAEGAPGAPGLLAVDHVAMAMMPGTMEEGTGFYKGVFGFEEMMAEDVATEYSAMNSVVLRCPANGVFFVLVEPAPGRRRSPIDEFLAYYGDSGTHHVALTTDDIVSTVRSLRSTGLDFTSTPDSYYDSLRERVGELQEDVDALREQRILVDRDHWGYLMQIFSKPVQSRPTFFFEIIQRKAARGFGSGNIKALFEAIEREQVMRGNA